MCDVSLCGVSLLILGGGGKSASRNYHVTRNGIDGSSIWFCFKAGGTENVVVTAQPATDAAQGVDGVTDGKE